MKFTKVPVSDRKKFSGDVLSGAICIKGVDAETPAGPAIADIQPHCKMIQQCLKTSLQFKKTESGLRNPKCNCSEVRNMNSHAKFLSHSLIVPVGLHHECNPDNKIMVYTLLDGESIFCFIKTSALEKLNLNGPEVHLKLSTVFAEKDITSEKITGLVICGVIESTNFAFPGPTQEISFQPRAVRYLGLKPHLSGHT